MRTKAEPAQLSTAASPKPSAPALPPIRGRFGRGSGLRGRRPLEHGPRPRFPSTRPNFRKTNSVFPSQNLQRSRFRESTYFFAVFGPPFFHEAEFFEAIASIADRGISPKMASRGHHSRARRRFFDNRTPRARSQTRREVDSRHRLTFLSFSAAVF